MQPQYPAGQMGQPAPMMGVQPVMNVPLVMAGQPMAQQIPVTQPMLGQPMMAGQPMMGQPMMGQPVGVAPVGYAPAPVAVTTPVIQQTVHVKHKHHKKDASNAQALLIIGIILTFIWPIIGLILLIVCAVQYSKSHNANARKSASLAKCWLIFCIIWLVIWVIVVIVIIAVPSVVVTDYDPYY